MDNARALHRSLTPVKSLYVNKRQPNVSPRAGCLSNVKRKPKGWVPIECET